MSQITRTLILLSTFVALTGCADEGTTIEPIPDDIKEAFTPSAMASGVPCMSTTDHVRCALACADTTDGPDTYEHCLSICDTYPMCGSGSIQSNQQQGPQQGPQ